MQITCEVIEVKAKKTGLDKEFKLVLLTNDEQVLKLQKYIAQDTVTIKVEEE